MQQDLNEALVTEKKLRQEITKWANVPQKYREAAAKRVQFGPVHNVIK